MKYCCFFIGLDFQQTNTRNFPTVGIASHRDDLTHVILWRQETTLELVGQRNTHKCQTWTIRNCELQFGGNVCLNDDTVCSKFEPWYNQVIRSDYQTFTHWYTENTRVPVIAMIDDYTARQWPGEANSALVRPFEGHLCLHRSPTHIVHLKTPLIFQESHWWMLLVLK